MVAMDDLRELFGDDDNDLRRSDDERDAGWGEDDDGDWGR